MSVSYDNLWELLSQKGLRRKDLCSMAGITTNVLAKLGRNESVQIEALSKICGALECSFDDIVSNTGDNTVIVSLPGFIFNEQTLGDDIIAEQFYTLDIEKLSDFPKPHTVNNITKTLIKYIKECKLNIDAVMALVTTLGKYNIEITIDANIIPEYDRVPKDFSNENEYNNLYYLEEQQAKNYLEWIIKEKLLLEHLHSFSEHSIDITNTDTSNCCESIQIIGTDGYMIKYLTKVITNDKTSEYPFNLVATLRGNPISYFKYNKSNIEKGIEKALSTLSQNEQTLIKSLFKHHFSFEEIYKYLDISNNSLLKKTFQKYYFHIPIRKLRHPSCSKNYIPLTYLLDTDGYETSTLYFTNEQNRTTVDISNLEWIWIENYARAQTVSLISKTIKADYVLTIYHSNKTKFNTTLLVAEVVCDNNISWHLFSIDILDNIFEIKKSAATEEIISYVIDEHTYPYLNLPRKEITLEELDLSIRTFNLLKRANIHTLDMFTTKTKSELMRIPNFNEKSLEEILQKAITYGYYLNTDETLEYCELDNPHQLTIANFARYYSYLYSCDNPEKEPLLVNRFQERCHSLGFSLNGVDWFLEMFSDTKYSLDDIKIIDKINNSQLLGSLILKKWECIVNQSNEDLLSRKNRVWFLVALNRLYQISQESKK